MLTQLKQAMLPLVVAIASVFAPIQTILLVALVLILMDLLTGVVVAIKNKESVTSAGLRRTVSKIFIYELALMAGHLAEKYMLSDSVPVVKMMSTMVALVELKSILENVDAIVGSDTIKALINKIGSINQ